MIEAVLIFNESGKPRISRFFDHTPLSKQPQIISSIHSLLSTRDSNSSCIVKYSENRKIVYRHLATLFFVLVVDSAESELAMLDLIQVFVQALDACFENICELDVVYHWDRVNYVLDELVMGGMVLETHLDAVLTAVKEMTSIKFSLLSISSKESIYCVQKITKITKFINQITRPLTRKLPLSDLQVSHVDRQGRGVVLMHARNENRTYSFTQARLLPGEKVALTVSHLKIFQRNDKKHIKLPEFVLDQSLVPSHHEVPAICPEFATCGGCDILHLHPDEQRIQRKNLVLDKLAKFGATTKFHHLPHDAVFDFVRLLPVNSNGKLKFLVKRGFMSRTTAALDECHLLHPTLKPVLSRLIAALEEFPVFDERSARGLLRDVLLKRSGEKTAIALVAAPVGDSTINTLRLKLADFQSQANNQIASVYLSITNEECARVEDASDLSNSALVAGDENDELFDLRCSLVDDVQDVVFSCLHKYMSGVLIVNAEKHHSLRRKYPDALFLNDTTDGLSQSAAQIVADIKGDTTPDLHSLCQGVKRVVVVGKFSEGMRTWCLQRNVTEILHFTSDLNKVTWDTEKLKEHYTLTDVHVFETRPHSMDVFIISRLCRY